MSALSSRQAARPRRMLVVIASYGEKNLRFLREIIRLYQAMTIEVEVVVVSEAPKDLPVRVVVGLPSEDPWSLPFAHKAVFAQNVEQYDLFVYSEDDMEVSQGSIEAFLRATVVLEPDELAGYLRYEEGPGETKLLTDVHESFRWKPDSVRRRGDYAIAQFTNEHAGFYILTQSQLRRALASGSFVRPPYEGRYALPETAATDPYTCCGFHKVVCISALDDFLIRHMSNLYVERHGVSLPRFREQVQTLLDIGNGAHPSSTLWAVESRMKHLRWSKSYYETPSPELLALIPSTARSILSVGCGWGAAEAELRRSGAQVTALPLDSVIGSAAAKQGAEVIHGTWDQCLEALGERRFDCVLVTNLLHLLPSPRDVLRQCARFVQAGGALVLSGPNFERVPWLVKRVFGAGEFRKLRSFDLGGISVCGPRTLAGAIKNAGLRVSATRWLNHSFNGGWLRGKQMPVGKLTARDWILQARR